MAEPTVESMEKSIYDDRSVARVLGMRRTMFVVPAHLVPILHHGCAAALAPRERSRLIRMVEDAGITSDGGAWVERVAEATLRALTARGEAVATELTRDVPELGERIPFGEGKRWQGEVGVSTRMLFLLATEGRIVRGRPRGSWTSSQYRWAAMSTWLPGGLRTVPRPRARAELARRWLAAFGAGTTADLRWWTGWSAAHVRDALGEIGAVQVEVDRSPAFVLGDDVDPAPPPEPWAALLPALDATVMGWFERDWYLGPHRPALFDRNGNAGPTVWWEGRVVGGWAQRADGEIAYRLLEDTGREAKALIEAKAASLADWLGTTRVTPRFRTPLERELRG